MDDLPISSIKFASGKLTLCEVLRRINDHHQGDSRHDKNIRELVDTATQMAKKMSTKLLNYNNKVFDDFWKKNKTYKTDLKNRLDPNYIAYEKEYDFDKDLIEYADTLPHMGSKNISMWLMKSAFNCMPGTRIVELGDWLGAGAAYLGIGNQGKNKIHIFDHFYANKSEVEKASKFNVKLGVGQDTLPIVKKYISRIPGNICFHKHDLFYMTWVNKPIGLFIDDVSKSPEAWDHTCKTFLPYIKAGGIMILMDYFYFQKTGNQRHKAQFNFMEKHQNNFRFIMRNRNGSEALFLVTKKYRYKK